MISDPYSRIRLASNQPKEGPALPWMPMEDQGDGGINMTPLATALKQRISRPDAPTPRMPTPDVNPGEPGIPAPNIPEYGKRPIAGGNGFGGGGAGGSSGGGFQSL